MRSGRLSPPCSLLWRSSCGRRSKTGCWFGRCAGIPNTRPAPGIGFFPACGRRAPHHTQQATGEGKDGRPDRHPGKPGSAQGGGETEMRDPFRWLPIPYRGRALALLGGLAVVLMATLNILGVPLRTGASPAGIISHEFAGSPGASNRILEAWGAEGRADGGVHLRVVYVFLLAYAGPHDRG